MKNNKLLLSGFAVIGILSIILRFVALFTSFDSGIGYFAPSIAASLNRAFALVCVGFGAAVIFTAKRETLPTPVYDSGLKRVFTSLLLSFAFGIAGILFVITSIASPSTLRYIATAGFLISAVYYLYDGIKPRISGTPYRVIAGAICAVMILSVVLLENFDMFTTLNNPEKIGVIFFFVSASLYTIEDARLTASCPSEKLYVFSLYITAFFGAYISVPGIAASLAGILRNSSYLIYYLIAFAFAIRATAHLISYLSTEEHATEEEVQNVDLT